MQQQKLNIKSIQTGAVNAENIKGPLNNSST